MSSFCFLGPTLCRQVAASPFIFIFLVEKLFFALWVIFLLLTQAFQIARNKTTNEMSNAHRLEYFLPDTTAMTELDSCTNHEDVEYSTNSGIEHKHGGGRTCRHNHNQGPKLINPFDMGAFSNCTEFCWQNNEHKYYELHSIPTPIKKSPPSLVVHPPSVKTGLLQDNVNMPLPSREQLV